MNNLRNLRKRAKLTQRQVAISLGITDATYVRWEHGTSAPSYGNLLKLLRFYQDSLKRPDLTAEELLK
jgi:transcriptional regulator with XRE-family HTH domain